MPSKVKPSLSSNSLIVISASFKPTLIVEEVAAAMVCLLTLTVVAFVKSASVPEFKLTSETLLKTAALLFVASTVNNALSSVNELTINDAPEAYISTLAKALLNPAVTFSTVIKSSAALASNDSFLSLRV